MIQMTNPLLNQIEFPQHKYHINEDNRKSNCQHSRVIHYC